MYSLRTKILTIALVLLAGLGGAFVYYSRIVTRNYKGLRLENVEKTVAFEKANINKTIAAMERGAISLAREGLLFYNSQSVDVGETSVLEYLRGFPTSIGGGFWFEPYAFNEDTFRAGIFAYYDMEIGEVRLDDSFHIDDDYDYHSTIWYREIIEQIVSHNQVAWTEPYICDTAFRLMTTAGAGIFNQYGELIGISILDWGIEEMIEALSSIKPTENSFLLLRDPIYNSIITTTYTGGSLMGLPLDINVPSLTLNGISYYLFSQFMDNGWELSMFIPENEIFAVIESENNRISIIIAFSLAIMLCLAYFLISKLINAPIKQLTSDVGKLALGNLDVPLNVSSKDEIGLLAGAFKKMALDLKESIDAYTQNQAEKERVAAELDTAAEIQTSMLPSNFPPFPGRAEFDLYATILPARKIGGDFYDFFLIDENNLAIVIADVSGKGIPAALFMVVAKTLIEDRACSGLSPGEVFEAVNNALCKNNDAAMFVTAFMGYYNIPSGRLVYVNAGHNPPFIKKTGKEYKLLEVKTSVVLGFMEHMEYGEEEITLEVGDTLYLYTDGVTEAMNEEDEFFTEQRLLRTLKKCRDCPLQRLLSAVKRDIDLFSHGAEQADDITMLALRVNHHSHPADRAVPAFTEPAMKELKIEARLDKVDEVIDFVNAELERHECPPDLQCQIDVAVDEIFTNIANYAYPSTGGSAAISITAGEDLLLKFEDTGLPYNPLEQADPNLDKPIIEREEGGLGIFLVKNIMDKVDYTRLDDKNILTMRKKIR